MALAPGTDIGPYRIVEQLGRGGMATVYKAHQAALARYVAVKVLPEFLAEEPGFAERFQQEAVAVAKLRHPNILAVYDYGKQDAIAYIVTEFVDGGTLADQVGKPLPVDYIADVLRPVASALDYAHARGILHRDIKPSNILLAHDGTPVLADFGLAKMLESGGPALTQAGMIVGTPEYMSPEQCSGGDVGPAADLYSLAVVAYEMLTGRPPFTAATPAAVIMAQLHNPLPPPRSLNPDITPAVEAVLLKGLARSPSARYGRAGELVKALAEATEDETEPAHTIVRPAPLTPPPMPAPVHTPAPAPPVPQSPWAVQPQAWPPTQPPAQVAPTPGWVAVLMIAGALLVLVLDIVFLVDAFVDPSNVEGALVIVTAETVILLILIVAIALTYWRPSTARAAITVAVPFLAIGTCGLGLFIGVPALWGVWRSPAPQAPYRRA
jgi:serine/threonine protein kinase